MCVENVENVERFFQRTRVGAAWVASGNGSTTGFTVAMVVRFDGRGEGTSEWGWHTARKFFGPTRSGYGDAYLWNMSLTSAGQLAGGSIWAQGYNDVKADWSNGTDSYSSADFEQYLRHKKPQ